MAKQTFTTGQVLTAAQVNSLQANDFNQTVSAKTASYVLVASDKGTRIEFNTSGSVTCTVNTGLFDAGDTVYIQNRGAGVVTITAGTATVNTSASLALNQWEGGLLYFISASAAVWYEYASTANGDITGVTAGTGISGGGTSGDVTITNTMATAIDAKGDLVAGTADNTFARLAVGNNGETLVADSSASTGLRWQSVGNSNVIINGGFDIWQRGSGSLVPTGSSYLNADRFYLTGSSGAVTFTRQTDVPTSKYFQYSMGMSTTAGNSASFGQRIEAANSVGLAGKTVTFSVYAKGISGSTNLFVNFYYPTAKDNYAGVTQIGSSNELSSNPSASWTRYSVTVTLPADVQNGLLVLLGRGTGACDTYITGMKLEIGSVATEFTRAGGTLAGELAACQRYYQRFNDGGGSVQQFALGIAQTTTAAYFVFTPFVPFRTKPTTLDILSIRATDLNTGFTPSGAFSIYSNGTSADRVSLSASTFSGLTQFRTYILESAGSTSAYIGIGAEL